MPAPTPMFGKPAVIDATIMLSPLKHPDSDERAIFLRVKPETGRSLVVEFTVSRYSPESSILRAYAEVMAILERYQGDLTQKILKGMVAEQIVNNVEPF